ncbi:MAG: helix-turn-helix transcriptional regulator [Mesorhizobium sp.]
MFGTSVLSNRESEIVRLILKGHSSKSTARLLGNSPETVKVHRKRIYAKMRIASQGELFSIFLRAVSCMPPDGQDDPLVYLDDFLPAPK